MGNWINVKRQRLGPYAIDAASDSEQLSEILRARQRGGGRYAEYIRGLVYGLGCGALGTGCSRNFGEGEGRYDERCH